MSVDHPSAVHQLEYHNEKPISGAFEGWAISKIPDSLYPYLIVPAICAVVSGMLWTYLEAKEKSGYISPTDPMALDLLQELFVKSAPLLLLKVKIWHVSPTPLVLLATCAEKVLLTFFLLMMSRLVYYVLVFYWIWTGNDKIDKDITSTATFLKSNICGFCIFALNSCWMVHILKYTFNWKRVSFRMHTDVFIFVGVLGVFAIMWNTLRPFSHEEAKLLRSRLRFAISCCIDHENFIDIFVYIGCCLMSFAAGHPKRDEDTPESFLKRYKRQARMMLAWLFTYTALDDIVTPLVSPEVELNQRGQILFFSIHLMNFLMVIDFGAYFFLQSHSPKALDALELAVVGDKDDKMEKLGWCDQDESGPVSGVKTTMTTTMDGETFWSGRRR